MGNRADDNIFEPGQMFGRYRIERRLGKGGMGSVFEAVHMGLKKRVAIKALHPTLSANSEIRERFLREGESASKIRHPHVVDIYDVGLEDELTFLVMELLEGEDLSRLIKRSQGPLEVNQTVDIMIPVIAAIMTAHEEGVLHRDLKPANVFLTQTKHRGVHPKVLDFGISKVLNDDAHSGLTSTGAVLGTPNYMSPEQAHGGMQLDHRSDQYALGVIMYECVTKKRPFAAQSMYLVLHQIVEGQFERPRDLNPKVSQDFESIILRAMSRDPKDRFADVQALGAEVLRYASPRVQSLWEPVFKPDLPEHVAQPTVDQVRSDPAPPMPLSELPVNTSQPSVPSMASQTYGQDPQSMSIGTSTFAGPGNKTPMVAGAALLSLAALLFLGIFAWSQSRTPATAEVVSSKSIAAPKSTPPPKAKPKFTVNLSVEPQTAKITLDGRDIGAGSISREMFRDGTVHSLTVRADGYEPYELEFSDTPPPEKIFLAKLPEVKKPTRRPTRRRPIVKRPPTDVKTKSKPTHRKGANAAPIIR